jgi:lysophospholipase L1-like esterase
VVSWPCEPSWTRGRDRRCGGCERGVSGATIRQVAEHQVAALAGVDADAVVISAGVNDAVARRSPEQVAHDVGSS